MYNIHLQFVGTIIYNFGNIYNLIDLLKNYNLIGFLPSG